MNAETPFPLPEMGENAHHTDTLEEEGATLRGPNQGLNSQFDDNPLNGI